MTADSRVCQLCFAEYPGPTYWFHNRHQSVVVCQQCGRAACAISEKAGADFALIDMDEVEDRVAAENPFLLTNSTPGGTTGGR